MMIKQNENQAQILGLSRGLKGTFRVPGDKSISHRALILGSIAEGQTRIQGMLEGEDCLATLQAMRQMGVQSEKIRTGEYLIQGVGSKGLLEPESILDLGNSGTATRLLIGLLSGYPIVSTITGDASIRRRPMLRVVNPIRQMGATILGRQEGRFVPLSIQGGNLHGIQYESPVASAQVKSAILLAGLNAKGETLVQEPAPSRDHSERMLKSFGASIQTEGYTVSIQGGTLLHGQSIQVPGDFSSAAFFIVAALLIPDSEITIQNVGLNSTRTGLLDVLKAMGGKVEILDRKEIAGEWIGNLRIQSSSLRGIEIGGDLVPRMIDEFPIFTLAAALAEGQTRVRDAKELRFKESDRIASITRQLSQLGIQIHEGEDGYTIHGPQKIQSGRADSEGDHRIAMTLSIASLLASGESQVENTQCICTSFPDFFPILEQVLVK